jgi:hypothetical protein
MGIPQAGKAAVVAVLLQLDNRGVKKSWICMETSFGIGCAVEQRLRILRGTKTRNFSIGTGSLPG